MAAEEEWLIVRHEEATPEPPSLDTVHKSLPETPVQPCKPQELTPHAEDDGKPATVEAQAHVQASPKEPCITEELTAQVVVCVLCLLDATLKLAAAVKEVACHVGAYTSHLLNQADGRAQQNQVDEKAQHNQADESAKQVDSDATAKPLQKGCAATEDAGDKAVASAPSSNAGGHAKRHAGQRDQMNPCQELLLAVACATGVFFTVGFSCYLTRWLSGESATLFGEW